VGVFIVMISAVLFLPLANYPFSLVALITVFNLILPAKTNSNRIVNFFLIQNKHNKKLQWKLKESYVPPPKKPYVQEDASRNQTD
jgi:hypothetical protein